MKAIEAFETSKHNSAANDHRILKAVLDGIQKTACEGVYHLVVEKLPPYTIETLKAYGYTIHQNEGHDHLGEIFDLIEWGNPND